MKELTTPEESFYRAGKKFLNKNEDYDNIEKEAILLAGLDFKRRLEGKTSGFWTDKVMMRFDGKKIRTKEEVLGIFQEMGLHGNPEEIFLGLTRGYLETRRIPSKERVAISAESGQSFMLKEFTDKKGTKGYGYQIYEDPDYP